MNITPDSLDKFKITSFGRRKKTPEQIKYASFNRRMLAATIDSALLMFAAPFVDDWSPIDTSTVQMYPTNPSDQAAVHQWIISVVTNREFVHSWVNNLGMQMTVICVFSFFCWHFWAATPGKMLLRMKIVDAKTEQPISDLQGILRVCGYFISATCFLLGFFWIGIDRRKQAWHDKLADTVVINLPWRKKKITPGSEAADPSNSPAPSATE